MASTTSLIIPAVLLLLALGGIVVRKTYYAVPVKELKRRAQQRDPTARTLYSAVTYGASLRGLLWIFIVVTGGVGAVLLARATETVLSFAVLAIAIYAGLSWLPASNVSRFGTRLTLAVTPVIVWLLGHLYPVLSRVVHVAQKPHTRKPHTGVFERSDLLDLIEQQQAQADNRLSTEELEIVRRALSFDEFSVADVLTPRKQVPVVKADDTTGPILIDELHKSGKAYALVRETPKGPYVGSIDIARLGITTTGTVRDIMNPTIYYLHEADSLTEALHVFFATNHALFLVVNSFEEFVGIVSIEDVLKQLVGHVPGDDFDQYADPSAVAARHTTPPRAEKAGENDEKVLE